MNKKKVLFVITKSNWGEARDGVKSGEGTRLHGRSTTVRGGVAGFFSRKIPVTRAARLIQVESARPNKWTVPVRKAPLRPHSK